MSILEPVRGFLARPWVRWGLLTLLALGVGWVAAVLLIPAPRIGVIRFADVIWSDTVISLEDQLRHAAEDPSIRAVVVEIDSPGGEAAASERLYFDILRLRQSKPVVVMVDSMAASGGYYMAAAADAIYCTPSSDVGNIGVISVYPESSFVVEDYLFTGPFKAFGSPRDSFVRQMEVLKDSFLECVFAQRGDRLQVDQDTLSRGEIYVGTRALQMGLVDGLGSREDAIAHAASLARVHHYTVVDVAAEMGASPPPTPLPPEAVSSRLSGPAWQPGFYYLYVAPQEGGLR
jgi:protease-4